MRSLRIASVSMLAALLAACGADSATSPSAAPPLSTTAPVQFLVSGCPVTLADLDALIRAALPNGLETAVTSQVNSIEDRYNDLKLAPAQDKARSLVAFLEKKYDDGQFETGKNDATLLQLLQMKTAIYCLVGLSDPTSVQVSPTETVGLAYPGRTTTLVGPNALAGTTIPAGAIPGSTPIKISIKQTDELLPTDLSQYPGFFRITADPSVTFTVPTIVGVCLNGLAPAGTDLRLARGTDRAGVTPTVGNIEILKFPPTEAGGPSPLAFLNCPDPAPGSAFVPRFYLDAPATLTFGPGMIWQHLAASAASASSAFASVFLPAPLHATSAMVVGCCRLGGLTSSFSPFGAVDINSAAIEATTALTSTVAAGTNVSPTVRLFNKDRRTLGRTDFLRGESVAFEVTSGAGKIIVNSTPFTTKTVRTGVDGLATIDWRVGAGSNTLTAKGFLGLATALSLQVPVPGAGNPVTFSATGTAASFGFGASGWVARLFTSEPDYAMATSGIDVTTPTLPAGFGSAGTGCPVAAAIRTTNFTVGTAASPTFLAITREFTAAPGAKLSVSVDNDFRVFLNGTLLNVGVTGRADAGAAISAQTPQTNGFFRHDGCPTVTGAPLVPTGDFTVPLTGLLTGVNRIVVIGLDRGVSAFLDAAIVP